MPNPRIEDPAQTNGAAGRLAPPKAPPPRDRRTGSALLALGAGLVGAGILAAILFATGLAGKQTQTSGVDAAALYRNAAPGVVDITSTGVPAPSSGFPFSPPHQSTETATGTGFEVDSQGHVVTAHHVVAGAKKVTIRLQDGKVRNATVVGSDDSTDVAVLRINPSGLQLHPLSLGNSGALAVGDPLVVIGDPFAFNRSLSTGVVSALQRTIQAPNGFTIANAVQTDAAINPGNSGGPLLSADGHVIGIADQIATGGSGANSFTGVGFAVPIDDVKNELSQLENGGHVKHAYLGVGIADTPANPAGAQLGPVQKGGPADKAGLKAGDVVTAVDGKAVHGANGLVGAIAAHAPGQKLTLSVQRGSRHVSVTVTLGTQPHS